MKALLTALAICLATPAFAGSGVPTATHAGSKHYCFEVNGNWHFFPMSSFADVAKAAKVELAFADQRVLHYDPVLPPVFENCNLLSGPVSAKEIARVE